MNSATLPLIRCGILFIAGILSLNWFHAVPPVTLGAITILYFVVILFSDAGDRQFAVVQTFLLYAGILLAGNYCAYKKLHDTEKNRLPNGYYHVSGVLLGKPILKNNHYRVILIAKQVRQHVRNFQLQNSKILLYIPIADNEFSGVKTGDEVSLEGQIQEFTTSTNPASFNMKEHYARKGILQQMFVETGCWNQITSAQNNSFSGFVRNTQTYALGKLDRLITENDERAVVKALLLGNRDDMPEHITESFSQTGAVHVLAVSGLHVGAVLYVFVLFFRKLPKNKWIQAVLKPLILCCIAIFYVILTGSSPSVTRAAIMFLLILIGKEWFRDVN
jgi:competence protein ComEC